MNVNLTLLVQIFNFLVAYYLLSKFLLKPALNIIYEDINYKSSLRMAIVEEEEKLKKKELHKKEQWRKCQYFFKQNKPEVDLELVAKETDTSSIKSPIELNDNERKQLVNDLVLTLKSKVMHND